MSRRARLITLILLLTAVLIVVATGYVRPLLVGPAYRIFTLLRLLVETVPQRLIWFALLVGALPVLWRSLSPNISPWTRRREYERTPAGPVADWLNAIRGARHSEYRHSELRQALRQLALDVLAERERLPKQQIWRRLEGRAIEMPPQVLAYLQGRRSPRPFPRRLRERLRRDDKDLEQVVRYIGDRLYEPEGPSR